MSLNENVKFSNLYKFISFCLFNRFYRGLCLEMISAVYDQETQEQIILKPIIYNRAKWLLISAAELNEYFQKLSDKFGWNWEMPI